MKHAELKKLLGEFEEKYLIIYNELAAKNSECIASNHLNKIPLYAEQKELLTKELKQLDNMEGYLLETGNNMLSKKLDEILKSNSLSTSCKHRVREIKHALLKLDQEKINLEAKKDELFECNQFISESLSQWKKNESFNSEIIKGFLLLAVTKVDALSQLYINQRDYLEAFRDIVYALANLCIRAITIGYVPQFFDTTTKPMDRIKREVKAIETALEQYVEKTEEQIKSLNNGTPSIG